MGVKEIKAFLEPWRINAIDLRRRMIMSPRPWSCNDGPLSGSSIRAGPCPVERKLGSVSMASRSRGNWRGGVVYHWPDDCQH